MVLRKASFRGGREGAGGGKVKESCRVFALQAKKRSGHAEGASALGETNIAAKNCVFLILHFLIICSLAICSSPIVS
jgi:hypothetical protein